MELSHLHEEIERQRKAVARLCEEPHATDLVAEIPDDVDERLTTLLSAVHELRPTPPRTFLVRG